MELLLVASGSVVFAAVGVYLGGCIAMREKVCKKEECTKTSKNSLVNT